MSLSGAGGSAAPLQLNTATGKFGYTSRWPPLISPVPPDPMESSSHHPYAYDPSNSLEAAEDEYADVRREVARSGHNLTSVMMDPRAPGGVSAELEQAWQQDASPAPTPTPSSSSSGLGTPGGPVSGTALTSVDVADLQNFARRAGPVLERYRQNHHAGPGQVKLYRPELLSSSQKAVTGAADLAECFRLVPGIFFHRDFQLADPVLFERLVVKATPDTQERLSQYLDVVETCLLKQISSRSQHFFEALTTLQDVRDRVAQACRQVLRLRAGLHDIDRKTVMGMIRIPRLAQRKVNLAMLLEKLRLIQDVQRSKELVQSLLGAGDYMGALDVLEDGRALMRDGGLGAVHCIRKLDRQLGEYLELVSDLMGSSFINLAVHFQDDDTDAASGGGEFMPRFPSSPVPDEEGQPSAHPSPPQQLSEALAAQLAPRVQGLVRLCRLSKVLERYRGRLTDTLKGVVKTVLLEYLDMADYQRDDDQEEEIGGSHNDAGKAAAGAVAALPQQQAGGGELDAGLLTSKVKVMEPGDFLDCLRLCFEQMLLPMERVALIHAFLDEQISVVLSRLLDRRPPSTRRSEGEGTPSVEASSTTTTRVTDPASSGAGPAPPSPSPSPSTKFKAFLDKRRLETGGGAGGSGSGAGAGSHGGPSSGGASGKPAPFKDEDQIKVLELQACKRLNDEVLKTLCNLCQRHIASLLVARKEAHARLGLADMKALWDATTHFVGAMERISGTAGFGLKSTLLTQAKLFVEHLHEENMAQLLAALDSERWVQADVGPERQGEIDRLTAGKAVLAAQSPGPPSPHEKKPSQQQDDDGEMSSSNDGLDAAVAAAGSHGVKPLLGGKKEPAEAVVGDGRYKVVWSANLLLSMLTNYLNVAANFPTLTMDVMQRVVDLLRLFNARTAQLVLGAGAIQAAVRLRSITAKHLALASQCLGLVLVLLPHVRAALAVHLQVKQQAFLVEMDRLRQEYAEHQEKLLAKFVAIIGELVSHSAANTGLRETDWDAMGSAACRFVEDVIKGISTMHKVLQQLLPPAQVQDVFSRVFDLLAHRLQEYLEEARPATTAGRQRLVDEVSHLVTSLSMLRGVQAEVLAQLEGTIKDKFSGSGSSGSVAPLAVASPAASTPSS